MKQEQTVSVWITFQTCMLVGATLVSQFNIIISTGCNYWFGLGASSLHLQQPNFNELTATKLFNDVQTVSFTKPDSLSLSICHCLNLFICLWLSVWFCFCPPARSRPPIFLSLCLCTLVHEQQTATVAALDSSHVKLRSNIRCRGIVTITPFYLGHTSQSIVKVKVFHLKRKETIENIDAYVLMRFCCTQNMFQWFKI